MEGQGCTPSTSSFWEKFYSSGEGKVPYEWYTSYQQLRTLLTPFWSPGKQILHIGAGNSILSFEIFSEKLEKSIIKNLKNKKVSKNNTERENLKNMILYDVDYCIPVLYQSQKNIRILHQIEESEKQRDSQREKKTQNKSKIKPKGKSNNTPFHSTSNQVFDWQFNFIGGDGTRLPFRDSCFDLVLDKGCLDAFLSTGKEETGENENLRLFLREIFRVLRKPKSNDKQKTESEKDKESTGQFLIVSGNDIFLTEPYFIELDWKIEVIHFNNYIPGGTITYHAEFEQNNNLTKNKEQNDEDENIENEDDDMTKKREPKQPKKKEEGRKLLFLYILTPL